VNPFFLDSPAVNITPKTKKQAATMVGPNLWCVDAGSSKVDYWAYPAGGAPTGNLSSPPEEPYGSAVAATPGAK
jgi:hypothetical protein